MGTPLNLSNKDTSLSPYAHTHRRTHTHTTQTQHYNQTNQEQEHKMRTLAGKKVYEHSSLNDKVKKKKWCRKKFHGDFWEKFFVRRGIHVNKYKLSQPVLIIWKVWKNSAERDFEPLRFGVHIVFLFLYSRSVPLRFGMPSCSYSF